MWGKGVLQSIHEFKLAFMVFKIALGLMPLMLGYLRYR
jgi:hypothetical protein